MLQPWLFLFTLLFCLPAQAFLEVRRGPGDSGGGDEVGLEFQAAFKSSLEIIRVSGRQEFSELTRIDWNQATRGIRVLATNRKLYSTSNGVRQESVALNTPAKKLVEVNRSRWKALTNLRVREGIALHEVLSLLGKEGTGQYPFSGLYLSMFAIAPGPIFGGDPDRAVPLPSQIAKVHSYHCRRRFVEGEQVSDSHIVCAPGQHLGFLSAEYTFYLYRAPERNNFSSRHHESFYGPLCGLANVARLSCDNPGEAEFGLSARMEGDFLVGITLTPSPEGGGGETYGFAALPNSRGLCPTNLVEARPWVAQPQSMLAPLPTSFMNQNNSLNNTLIRTKDRGVPANFEVWRQPGLTPCAADGSCPWPDGGMMMAQSVPYFALTPRVCVIPKQNLPLD